MSSIQLHLNNHLICSVDDTSEQTREIWRQREKVELLVSFLRRLLRDERIEEPVKHDIRCWMIVNLVNDNDDNEQQQPP